MQKREKSGVANIVLKSTDNGQSWQNISEGLPKPVQQISADGINILFADDAGLWFSAADGIYHNKSNTKGPFWEKETIPENHTSIAPGKTGIYAYNYGGAGIFHKTNGSSVWTPVFPNFKENSIFNVFETADGTIFIGTYRGLFKSTNNGKSWKQLPIGGGGKIIESNGVLLATNEAGILRSTDDGENWAVVIGEEGVGIDVERIEGGFAAINYSTAAKTRRIRTSYDGGKTWKPIDVGFPGQTIIDNIWIRNNEDQLAQGNVDSNWHAKEAPHPQLEYKTTIIQVGENFFCGHTNGIYRSSDKGKTWKLVRCAEEGKMFKLFVSGNVIYAIQTAAHC
ncbi:MAG: WD40/YVTN/BNR-like repeat-containing protein [Ferruginibacter sp.]